MSHRPYLRARVRGVSLTELLIVVLVVAAALVPIFGLLSSNATHVIERFRYERYPWLVQRFASPATGAAEIKADSVLNELFILPAEIPEPMQRLYFRFQREAWVQEVEPGHLAKFLVRVTWKNNQRQDCSFETATFVRNREYHHGKP
jgi:hypothetical protein